MGSTDFTIDIATDMDHSIQNNEIKYPLIKQNLVTTIGPFTIDKVIFDAACKDFWRVVLPSFATKICGRMMMLHHIIASNAASLAYLSTNLVAAGYIAAISAGIEFLKLYELYNDENKVTKLEKFKSASAIALKTGIKVFYGLYELGARNMRHDCNWGYGWAISCTWDSWGRSCDCFRACFGNPSYRNAAYYLEANS